MRTIIVCGGRNYTNWKLVYDTLDRLNSEDAIAEIKHGCANGADRIADDWALSRLIARTHYPAEWEFHGKAAGPLRNQKMLDDGADLVVAFPGGRGTEDMVSRAVRAKIPVVRAG